MNSISFDKCSPIDNLVMNILNPSWLIVFLGTWNTRNNRLHNLLLLLHRKDYKIIEEQEEWNQFQLHEYYVIAFFHLNNSPTTCNPKVCDETLFVSCAQFSKKGFVSICPKHTKPSLDNQIKVRKVLPQRNEQENSH